MFNPQCSILNPQLREMFNYKVNEKRLTAYFIQNKKLTGYGQLFNYDKSGII